MASGQCKVCSHSERATIDADLVAGVGLTAISRQRGMSPPSVMRHRDNHLKARVAAAAAARDAERLASDLSVVDRLAGLADLAVEVAQTSARAGSSNTPAAIREARETLTRLGELRGDFAPDDPTARAKGLLERLVDGMTVQRQAERADAA